MKATYFSNCCSAPMIMQKTTAIGGVFYCQECKKQCEATEAVSHCCHTPVLMQREMSFPFICSCCNGDCELGDPRTPTIEQMLDTKVLQVLKDFKEDKLTEDQAWLSIIEAFDNEIDSVLRNQIEGIVSTVKMTGLPDSVVMGNEYLIRGYEMARHACVHIAQQALPPEKQ